MKQLFLSPLVAVVFSMMFFTFTLKALPIANTKLILATIGLVMFIVNKSRARDDRFVNADMAKLVAMAIVVSLIGVASVTLNGTTDYAYSGYIFSMLVWVSAAYVVTTCIKAVHGRADVWLVGNYMLAVCVFQCIMALWIDSSESMKTLVDSYVEQGQDFLNEVNVERLYGIGASLDVAGSRFAVAIVVAGYMLTHIEEKPYAKCRLLYWLALAIIVVVGNMIARTTTVGILVLGAYWLWATRGFASFRYGKLLGWLLGILAVAIPIIIYMYNHNADFHDNLRFAFEGFFSLVEKGTWNVASNERLKGMYVFPETLKTWIIGDGYFSNPIATDPYFTGKFVGGYYMGTDVGYLRFIFYFGSLGLAAFSIFFLMSGHALAKKFPSERTLMWLIVAINFIVWFKVSTDIFPALALLLAASGDNKQKQ